MSRYDSLSETLEQAAELLRSYEKEQKGEPIKIWPFDDAPPELRKYSDHGGDEDWVAFVPQWIWDKREGYIPFLEAGCFGVCCVGIHQAPGGMVVIGAHA